MFGIFTVARWRVGSFYRLPLFLSLIAYNFPFRAP